MKPHRDIDAGAAILQSNLRAAFVLWDGQRVLPALYRINGVRVLSYLSQAEQDDILWARSTHG